MSQENINVVRAAFDAYNAGRMDDLRELYDPDIIMRNAEGWPEIGPFIGPDAVIRQWERQRGTWDSDEAEPVGDFTTAGDRVVVRLVWRGTGRGPEMNFEVTEVFTIRSGKILVIEHFRDHAEALAAIGLNE